MESFKEDKQIKSKNSVWHYFELTEDNIKKCENLIKCIGGSTSGLHVDLKRKHMNLLKREQATSPCSSVEISEVAKRTNKSFGIIKYFSNTSK